MKTVALFLAVLRLASALPTPADLDDAIATLSAPGAAPSNMVFHSPQELDEQTQQAIKLGAFLARLAQSARDPDTARENAKDVMKSPLDNFLGSLSLTRRQVQTLDLSGRCCFDPVKSKDPACDVKLCLKNFFASPQGKPLEESFRKNDIDVDRDIITMKFAPPPRPATAAAAAGDAYTDKASDVAPTADESYEDSESSSAAAGKAYRRRRRAAAANYAFSDAVPASGDAYAELTPTADQGYGNSVAPAAAGQAYRKKRRAAAANYAVSDAVPASGDAYAELTPTADQGYGNSVAPAAVGQAYRKKRRTRRTEVMEEVGGVNFAKWLQEFGVETMKDSKSTAETKNAENLNLNKNGEPPHHETQVKPESRVATPVQQDATKTQREMSVQESAAKLVEEATKSAKENPQKDDDMKLLGVLKVGDDGGRVSNALGGLGLSKSRK